MSTEQVPPPAPPPTQLWFRWGLSGKLLAIGGLIGIVAAFLPLVSVSMQTPTIGAFNIPGMPAGVNTPTMNVSVSKHAMVVENWRGQIGLAAYVAALVFALVLYPPGGLSQKSMAWAGVGIGALAVLLAVWQLVLALRSGSDLAGMFGVQMSPGIGAFVNVVAAGIVAIGGFLKAREEKLV